MRIRDLYGMAGKRLKLSRKVKSVFGVHRGYLAILTLMALLSPCQGWTVGNPMRTYEWRIERVDAPKLFGFGSSQSLQVDAQGCSHMVFGGDFLYYAWHDGIRWHMETVDDSPFVGDLAALALDSGGNPHVAYHSGSNNASVLYATRAEGKWHLEVVDSELALASPPSITMDREDRPHIVYHDRRGKVIKHARRVESTWEIETVVGVEYSGGLSAAIGLDGTLHVSYCRVDGTLMHGAQWSSEWNFLSVAGLGGSCAENALALDREGGPNFVFRISSELKFAKWSGSSWNLETVDEDVSTKLLPSLAFDGENVPHVGYHAAKQAALKYARRKGETWEVQVVESGGDSIASLSLALDGFGYPRFSYLKNLFGLSTLNYARWNGLAWEVETIERGGKAGLYSSLALDASGSPHICYFDERKGELKYARKIDGAWTFEVVEDVNVGGHKTNLKLDSKGNPHVSYYDNGNKDLKYAFWTGSYWEIQAVETEGDVGRGSSLVVDRNDHAHVAYCDYTNHSLKYAHWTGSIWEIQTVDSEGDCSVALALDSQDFPQIVYSYGEKSRYARWTGVDWAIETIPGAKYGAALSLALDENDQPHISLCGPARYARKRGGVWEVTIFDSKALCEFTSIRLDRKGYPHIGYYDQVSYYTGLKNLKYARWTGLTWDVQIVDEGSGIGLYPSLEIDQEDHPHISYYDKGLGDLKYATGRLVGQDISIFPIPLDFGEVLLGQQLDRTVLVKNDGVLSLQLETIGPPDPPFEIVGGTCADGLELSPTEECSILVRFTPATLGKVTSELIILSNDLDEREVFLRVEGTGVYPDISVAPVLLTFGSLNVGSQSPSQSIQVTNDGSAVLHISEIKLAGADPSHFAIQANTCGGRSLKVKESCTLQVFFHPLSVGAKTAQVLIASDDMDENPAVVELSGTGVEPKIEVIPLRIDFGNINLGDASHKVVQVKNQGLGELTIVSIGSLSAPYRRVNDTCTAGLRLLPNESCSIIVRFEPTEAGTFGQSLSLFSDDPHEPNVWVEVTGRSDGARATPVIFPSNIPRIDPLNNWHWRNPKPHGLDMADVTYGKGIYVAVGEYGAIATSLDGTSWTVVSPPGLKASFGGVAYGNGKFVAVGWMPVPGKDKSYGVIVTSPDGITWTMGVRRMEDLPLLVAFLNDEFIILTDSNRIYFSTDGKTWSPRTVGRASYLSGITYGAGTYVVVGYYEENPDGLNSKGCIFTSTDGVEWKERASGTRWGLGSVAYGNGTFVATGSGGDPLASTDGIFWLSIPGTGGISGVIFAKGRFVGIRYGYLLSSSDGWTWEIRAVIPPSVGSISYGGELFFALGWEGAVYVSSDGLSWSNQQTWLMKEFSGITFGKGIYVACGGSKIFTSSNGVQWKTISLGGTYKTVQVIFGGDRFVAIHERGSTFTSLDGISWAGGYVIGCTTLMGVAYGKGLFVTVDREGNIFTSEDGLKWTKRVSSGKWLWGVVYGDGAFVAYGNAVLKSKDGVSWDEFPVPATHGYFTEMVYGNGVYVARSVESICTSLDAINWISHEAWFYHVAYGDGLFIGFWEGTLYVSPDGAKWTRKDLATSNGLGQVGYGGGTFFTWSSRGMLQQSDHTRGPRIAWTDQTVDFGRIPLGVSELRTVVFRNEGTENLVIGIISQPSKPFDTLRENCSGSVLAPEETCSVTFRFDASLTGEFSEICEIPSNDPDRPVLRLKLLAESVGPDLRGQWLSLKITCKTKCKLTGILAIENTGALDARTSTVKFYLSNESTHSDGDTFLKQASTGTIRAGGTKIKRLSYNLPSQSFAIDKYLIAVLDAENIVMEADETNNGVVYGPIQ